MIRGLLVASAALFFAACADGTHSRPTDTVREAAPPPQPMPSAQAAGPGERAPFVVEGDVVRVNNRICAVSRSPMGEETLGKHVSRVRYDGPDSRFAGKTLEFNQCCPMCLDRFPEIWSERRDDVMRFHGLLAEG